VTRAARAFALATAALASLALVACTPESQAEHALYTGINALRAEAGMPPLAYDPDLARMARGRSADMAARGYFGHTPPDGCGFACRLGGAHPYIGEVIAWNTHAWPHAAAGAVDAWRQSPSHRATLLDCPYDRIGTGAAQAPDGRIILTALLAGGGC
jgi:uncharacterized protein YkwD